MTWPATDDAEAVDGPMTYLAFVLTKGLDARASAARLRARLEQGIGTLSAERVLLAARVFEANVGVKRVEERERELVDIFAEWLTSSLSVGDALNTAVCYYRRACSEMPGDS
jgi:hypothetical protein